MEIQVSCDFNSQIVTCWSNQMSPCMSCDLVQLIHREPFSWFYDCMGLSKDSFHFSPSSLDDTEGIILSIKNFHVFSETIQFQSYVSSICHSSVILLSLNCEAKRIVVQLWHQFDFPCISGCAPIILSTIIHCGCI